MVQLNFRTLHEERVGPAWASIFAHGWPGWQCWFAERQPEEPVSLSACYRALRSHMPGADRLVDDLVNEVQGDEDAARFLTFWTPPRYLIGCSQAAIVDDHGPLLIRNYDLDPALSEATLFQTSWMGSRVVGMVDAMSGLSDGMNEHGMAISLAFGGRAVSGKGFGVPFILRYVLETCRDVSDAVEALRSIPCHMSYNLTLIDRSGCCKTVMLSPDRPVMVQEQAWSANHQLGVEWLPYAAFSGTAERAEHLENLLAHSPSGSEMEAAFLSPPLHRDDHIRKFVTVFTAAYRPSTGKVDLIWSSGQRLSFGFGQTAPAPQAVKYPTTDSVQSGASYETYLQ